ncbi:Selenophosphate-dependent tRNA 2-selenouridine synthase [Rubrivivax sp. A210]|uniref:tRNA 2-selenouridine(34) synthase MnmH n=1 Tax=Rubrivivax sp. A210 TaxID=2772301 RepID=UPI0019B38939|nr:tRNA 2-selenouridine(34) synthase MnmH [Rubrivivax sp. A210]CAD5371913.1 Selenophosphate-dependent tRNA 2-selenouridine synthase [Rubrivivax sp. A210]
MSLNQADIAELMAGTAACDLVIDARSPAEFAEDHLPGAVNWPVLDNDERREVGTLYKQVSPLAARKLGAALVARNIAAHLDREMANKPREWRPLVYCWRGGQRSGSLAWFLSQIGFRTLQLAGGYKAFRALVSAELLQRPAAFEFRVLAARTGSGKTRLLQALAAAGAQVLDLEALACHRGSVLGGMPGRPQPAQKRFDTEVWSALRGFDPGLPVYVESESARIGRLTVPEALLRRMREQGTIVRVAMDDAARLQLLLEEYGHFASEPEAFCKLIEALTELRGRALVQRWQAMARDGQWPELFAELMAQHYDPLYTRSLARSFGSRDDQVQVDLGDGGPAALQAAAQRLIGG